MRSITKMLAAVALAGSTFAHSTEEQWPRVKSLERTFDVFAGVPLEVEIPIQSEGGVTVYVLSCRSDDFWSDNQPGSFLCTLNESGSEKDRESSLLSEDESAVWFSRGQYHAEQLIGDCASYPEYGASRTFRLRGMRLSLVASQIERRRGNGLAHVRISVAVRPDATAQGKFASRPGYLPPKFGKCRPIKKGDEPLMCRDRNFSWTECKNIGV